MAERDERQVVWVRGALADPAEASVHWSDHGLTVGDGVFETIELRRGTPFALTRHLDRLERSAGGVGDTQSPGLGAPRLGDRGHGVEHL